MSGARDPFYASRWLAQIAHRAGASPRLCENARALLDTWLRPRVVIDATPLLAPSVLVTPWAADGDPERVCTVRAHAIGWLRTHDARGRPVLGAADLMVSAEPAELNERFARAIARLGHADIVPATEADLRPRLAGEQPFAIAGRFVVHETCEALAAIHIKAAFIEAGRGAPKNMKPGPGKSQNLMKIRAKSWRGLWRSWLKAMDIEEARRVHAVLEVECRGQGPGLETLAAGDETERRARARAIALAPVQSAETLLTPEGQTRIAHAIKGSGSATTAAPARRLWKACGINDERTRAGTEGQYLRRSAGPKLLNPRSARTTARVAALSGAERPTRRAEWQVAEELGDAVEGTFGSRALLGHETIEKMFGNAAPGTARIAAVLIARSHPKATRAKDVEAAAQSITDMLAHARSALKVEIKAWLRRRRRQPQDTEARCAGAHPIAWASEGGPGAAALRIEHAAREGARLNAANDALESEARWRSPDPGFKGVRPLTSAEQVDAVMEAAQSARRPKKGKSKTEEDEGTKRPRAWGGTDPTGRETWLYGVATPHDNEPVPETLVRIVFDGKDTEWSVIAPTEATSVHVRTRRNHLAAQACRALATLAREQPDFARSRAQARSKAARSMRRHARRIEEAMHAALAPFAPPSLAVTLPSGPRRRRSRAPALSKQALTDTTLGF